MFFASFLVVLMAVNQLEATLQRDLLTYINDLRALHSAGPLISSPTASALAQKAAVKFAKERDVNSLYNSAFSTNHCEYTGKLSQLAQTCTVAWYTTMRDHSWCSPRANGKSRPFVNMVWNATSRAGTGISKGSNGKYYVVTYFSPKKTSDVKGNVHPIKIVTKASDKAKCAKGFVRFGSSCFKFHPEKVSWEEAVNICAKENATLTSVRNQKEEKFLRTLQEKGNGKGWMWIGLHDRIDEGNFAWMDGLDFASGVCAPVNANGGECENCVAWTTDKPMSCWSDKKCSDRNAFMCRMPVDGKATFRTEILFKKFRWNPNFRDPNSKAFRDLRRGLRITFNEVFQRASGRIGGGFRSLKVKSVRPLSIQGRRRGTAVTLSIQFRAKVADPTLKFQKFLRPSERLISITVDSPVVHQSAISRTMCSFPCKKHGSQYCHNWSSYYSHHGYSTPTNYTYQHTGYTNTGYPGYTTYHSTGYDSQCPSYCGQYTYSTCPSYCSQSCCTQGSTPTSATPTVTKPPVTQKPAPTVAVNTGTRPPSPTNAPASTLTGYNTGYSSYQPYNQCNTCQTLYSSPLCYTFCDEQCCKQSKDQRSPLKKVAMMKQQLKKFEDIVKNGKSRGVFLQDGNAVPIQRSRAKSAVRTLQRNIAKLTAKIEEQKRTSNDDYVFEQEIKQAEKQSGEANGLPDFEKELENLDNEINESDIGNSNEPKNLLEKDKDLENFDIDVKPIDYAEAAAGSLDKEYRGPPANTSYSHEVSEKEDQSSRNRYNGPGRNTTDGNENDAHYHAGSSSSNNEHQASRSNNTYQEANEAHYYTGPRSSWKEHNTPEGNRTFEESNESYHHTGHSAYENGHHTPGRNKSYEESDWAHYFTGPSNSRNKYNKPGKDDDHKKVNSEAAYKVPSTNKSESGADIVTSSKGNYSTTSTATSYSGPPTITDSYKTKYNETSNNYYNESKNISIGKEYHEKKSDSYKEHKTMTDSTNIDNLEHERPYEKGQRLGTRHVNNASIDIDAVSKKANTGIDGPTSKGTSMETPNINSTTTSVLDDIQNSTFTETPEMETTTQKVHDSAIESNIINGTASQFIIPDTKPMNSSTTTTTDVAGEQVDSNAYHDDIQRNDLFEPNEKRNPKFKMLRDKNDDKMGIDGMINGTMQKIDNKSTGNYNINSTTTHQKYKVL